MFKYTDDTAMPFGQHKDKPLKDVPAGYLLYIERTFDTMNPSLAVYIDENRTLLETQAAAERKEFFRKQKNEKFNRL